MDMIYKIDDAIGKTIRGIAMSDNESEVAVAFADDTACVLRAEAVEGCEPEIVLGACLNVLNFGARSLVEAGIVTREHVAELVREEDEKRLAEQEAYDRKTYERLRKKFEGTQKTGGE